MPTSLFLRTGTQNGLGYLDTSASSTAFPATGVVNTTAGGTDIQWTQTAGGAALEWITPRSPAGGWTLSGEITAVVYCNESDAAANAGLRFRLFKRAANGTITELGGSPYDYGTEFATTNTQITHRFTPSSTSFAEDDRLIIRPYITAAGGTMAAGHTATFTYNGNSGQLANSRLTLTETITWKTEWSIGSAAQTLSAVTQSAAGGPIAAGSAAQTLGAVTQAATGGWLIAGTAAQTLGDLTQTAAGAVILSGSAAQTLDAIVQSAAGASTVAGAAAQTLGDLAQAATARAEIPPKVPARAQTIFDRAAAAIFANTHLSVPATYRRGGRGAASDVRIIRTLATDLVNAGGRQFRALDGQTISVNAADGTPAAGDTWTLADGVILTALDVERSVEGDSYTVTVR